MELRGPGTRIDTASHLSHCLVPGAGCVSSRRVAGKAAGIDGTELAWSRRPVSGADDGDRAIVSPDIAAVAGGAASVPGPLSDASPNLEAFAARETVELIDWHGVTDLP